MTTLFLLVGLAVGRTKILKLVTAYRNSKAKKSSSAEPPAEQPSEEESADSPRILAKWNRVRITHL